MGVGGGGVGDARGPHLPVVGERAQEVERGTRAPGRIERQPSSLHVGDHVRR